MKSLEEYKKDLKEKEYFVKHNKECLENYKKLGKSDWMVINTTERFISEKEKELPALRALVEAMERRKSP